MVRNTYWSGRLVGKRDIVLEAAVGVVRRQLRIKKILDTGVEEWRKIWHDESTTSYG